MFQQLSEPTAGDMRPLFQWLANYCAFNAETAPKSADSLSEFLQELNLKHDPVESDVATHEITTQTQTSPSFEDPKVISSERVTMKPSPEQLEAGRKIMQQYKNKILLRDEKQITNDDDNSLSV